VEISAKKAMALPFFWDSGNVFLISSDISHLVCAILLATLIQVGDQHGASLGHKKKYVAVAE